MYISALKGIPGNIAKKRARELLEEVGSGDFANKKVKTFSGGMKQRVGIAQALLNNPGEQAVPYEAALEDLYLYYFPTEQEGV